MSRRWWRCPHCGHRFQEGDIALEAPPCHTCNEAGKRRTFVMVLEDNDE